MKSKTPPSTQEPPPAAEQPGPLPLSTLWDFPQTIVSNLHHELKEFYEHQIREAEPRRKAFSRQSPEVRRAMLRKLTGAIDLPATPKPVRKIVGETAQYSVSLVSWALLPAGGPTINPGILPRCFGLLLEPKSIGKLPAVVAVPDATHSAADSAGLTSRLPEDQQTACRLAAAGYVVFAPFFTQRRAFSEPWLEDRMWLMRLAYQTGRHIIGSELVQIGSILDFLATLPQVDSAEDLGIVGYGQGGMTALFAGALDTRLKVTVCAGYLGATDGENDVEAEWDQPEDRMIWNLRSYFSNDQIAALIHPRTFHAFWKPGKSAAIDDDVLADVAAELLPSPPGPPAPPGPAGYPGMDSEEIARLANEQFSRWQAYFRNKAIDAANSLQTRWTADYSSLAAYEKSIEAKREAYYDLIGRYPPATGPFEAESVQIFDEPGFTGYRLSIRVYDGVHAYGILAVPKGIKEGEKRPVVFVQHGSHGLPEDPFDPAQSKDTGYRQYGLRLLLRGYIVFSAMIATQSNPERMRINRRSQSIGLMPVGIDVVKYNRQIDYLSTLPYVDADRIAHYGLSYGGYTGLWTGPGVSRFKVIVCSGHFNDWNAKTTDLTQGTAFPFYPYCIDQYNFGMLPDFNHSDLASLIAPRAFMIEIGDFDTIEVEPRSLVDREIAKVEELYRRLSIPERGATSRYPGPHAIHGDDAYPFLDRWLDWKPLNEGGK